MTVLVDTEAVATEIWEAKYNADQLKAMLAKGHAVANDNGEPSYPIADVGDLKNAIKAVGRGGGSHNKIRAHIIKRARALGQSDLIPDDWSASGASKSAKESAITVGESIPLTEAARGQSTGRRMRIKLIDAGWGSSGYYSPKVLQEAAKNGIFADGQHMYLDHPTATEQMDRPERSVRDLAAVIEGPVAYRDGGLYADARLYDDYRWIEQKKDAIGLSIRASGVAEAGEAEGRQGMIITSLTAGNSVDFVTHAGRGGQILELLESARAQTLQEARNIGGWLESRLHSTFTELTDCMYGDGQLTRDERIGLSSAIGDALDAFVKKVEADYPQLYQRDLYDEPPEPGEPGEAPADMAETTGMAAATEWARSQVGVPYVPGTPTTSAAMAETITPAPPAKPTQEGAPMTVTTTSTGTTTGAPPQGGVTQLSEAERLLAENTDLKSKLAEAQLTIAKHGDNDRELEETKRGLEEAKRENLRLKANDAARAKALETLAESTLPKAAHPEVVAAVTGDSVPLNDDGALDEAALVTNIKAAIEKQRRYLAQFAEEAGLGTVRGLGSSGNGDEVSEADVEAGLKAMYTRIGLPSEVADIAAKGR